MKTSTNQCAEVDFQYRTKIVLSSNKTHLLIAAFQVPGVGVDIDTRPVPDSEVLQNELGLSATSENASSLIWEDRLEAVGGQDFEKDCNHNMFLIYHRHVANNTQILAPSV